MKLVIEFTPEQIAQIALEAAKIVAANRQLPQRPLTMKEYADAVGISVCTVWRRVEAGLIEKVPNTGKRVLIKYSELERALK